ncbi:MAG: winged helix-turn-helix transcriptional regulator [Desulfosarcina sp.]|nr:winged helix-turn-helix transcriptional regulator [Desulfosarcina sp.]MBC2764484.1 winged helix-turn-helix transcriptional regulator [Desulfosarcina sp.]
MSSIKFNCPCGRVHLINVDLDVKKQKAHSIAERKQIICSMLDKDRTQAEIARRLNMSQANVSQFIRRHQLKKKECASEEFDEPKHQNPLFKTFGN